MKKDTKDLNVTIRMSKRDRVKLELIASYNEISQGNVIRALINNAVPCEELTKDL
tara:strand:+ start:445 stop:609 length:165 start_codon:yes stop_codon:yes gene_type:complete